ncbi:MAG: hypothetical protein ABSG91_04340 [Syntrophobacteraceae bacterium]|jgi:hypothetical protein
MTDVMMAVAILPPIVAGFLIFVIRNSFARGVVVVITASVLIPNSILFAAKCPLTCTPPAGFDLGMLITVLDYAILVLYLILDIKLRNRHHKTQIALENAARSGMNSTAGTDFIPRYHSYLRDSKGLFEGRETFACFFFHQRLSILKGV